MPPLSLGYVNVVFVGVESQSIRFPHWRILRRVEEGIAGAVKRRRGQILQGDRNRATRNGVYRRPLDKEVICSRHVYPVLGSSAYCVLG